MEVLRTAILDFCRRSKGKPFCPVEVVRQMFPEDWELFIEDVWEEMMRMHRDHLIELSQDGVSVSKLDQVDGQTRIIGLRKPK